MNVYLVLCQKELRELIRSYKLIWMPLVFVLLGISQPVTSYFLPDLLAGAGNLPAGSIIEIPLPEGKEVLAQTLQQFGTVGALIIALAFMGVVSSERSSGVASMILVKPVPYSAYIASKWTMLLLLVWLSLTLGYCGAWYYTALLFGDVNASTAFSGLFIYGLWLSLIGTLTLVFSTWLRSPAAAAFSALSISMLLAMSASLLPDALAWSPGQLSALSISIIMGEAYTGLGQAVAAAFIMIAGSAATALWRIKKTELL